MELPELFDGMNIRRPRSPSGSSSHRLDSRLDIRYAIKLAGRTRLMIMGEAGVRMPIDTHVMPEAVIMGRKHGAALWWRDEGQKPFV